MSRKTYKLLGLTWLCLCSLTVSAHADTPTLDWQLLRTISRAPNHFTQGLVYADQQLFESTGRFGQSQIIAYDANTLTIQKQHVLREDVFGEGLTYLNKQLYQSSWKSREIFVYDTNLQPLKTLQINGDSWGLTTDGRSIIMSDGSDTLRFLDPHNGKTVRTLVVTDGAGQPLKDINELEWVNGDILANVWHRDNVLVIDSKTGRLKGQFNFEKLSGELVRYMPFHDGEQVLNGLAWNPATNSLLLTGKDWPVWFEIKITLH